MKLIFLLVLALCVMLTGCMNGTPSQGSTSVTASQMDNTSMVELSASQPEEEDGSISISLSQLSTLSAPGVTYEDGAVTITQGGIYRLSGTMDNGSVIVQAPAQTVQLILDGVDITNTNGPAILFEQTEESLVSLAQGSKNFLADGGTSDYDAALYSVSSLTIGGEGSLTVTGSIEEGIATEMHLTIDSGNIHITSKDDGLNANNDGVSIITINGGYLFINASGDGIDSNGDLTINGGTVITQSTILDQNGGLDADGTTLINGGTVIATGAKLSTPSSASTQKSVMAQFSSTQNAGTVVDLRQGEQSLFAFTPEQSFQVLLYSSPQIADDVTYHWYTGGTLVGNGTDGYYQEGATGGSSVQSATTQSLQTTNSKKPR